MTPEEHRLVELVRRIDFFLADLRAQIKAIEEEYPRLKLETTLREGLPGTQHAKSAAG